MATIDDEIAALREAMVAGVKAVETRDGGVMKRVDYPSFADLKARLEWLEGQRSDTALPGGRRRVILATF